VLQERLGALWLSTTGGMEFRAAEMRQVVRGDRRYAPLVYTCAGERIGRCTGEELFVQRHTRSRRY